MKGLIVTYLLTFGGAAVALFQPFIGLLVYISFSILKPDALWFWSVPPGNYSRVIAVALLLGWALRLFGTWQLGQARGVVIALAGYMAWSIFSSLFAVHELVAWAFVAALAKIALPVLVGITLIDSPRQLNQLVWVIVLSQGYVALEFNRGYYSGGSSLTESGFGGMDNNCVAIALVTCIGVSFFLGLYARERWQKGLAWGATTLMAHAVLFSQSRGGMLALGVTGVVSILLIDKRPKQFLAIAAAALILFRLAGSEVRARFFTSFAESDVRDASAQSRTQLWANCWDTMCSHSLLGVGPNNWPLIAPKYGWPAGKEGHTLWLQIGAELGFPGLGFLLAYYGLCVRRLWPIARGQVAVRDPALAHMARMVIASITGFAVSAQFVSLEGLETPYYVVLIGAGVLKLWSAQVSTAPGLSPVLSRLARPIRLASPIPGGLAPAVNP